MFLAFFSVLPEVSCIYKTKEKLLAYLYLSWRRDREWPVYTAIFLFDHVLTRGYWSSWSTWWIGSMDSHQSCMYTVYRHKLDEIYCRALMKEVCATLCRLVWCQVNHPIVYTVHVYVHSPRWLEHTRYNHVPVLTTISSPYICSPPKSMGTRQTTVSFLSISV